MRDGNEIRGNSGKSGLYDKTGVKGIQAGSASNVRRGPARTFIRARLQGLRR